VSANRYASHHHRTEVDLIVALARCDHWIAQLFIVDLEVNNHRSLQQIDGRLDCLISQFENHVELRSAACGAGERPMTSAG
jgi:hypothetical protein